MAISTTFTSARTFARQEILKLQVKVMLRRGAQIDARAIASVEKGLDERWIRWIMLFGIDGRDELVAELSLEIDWVEHKVLLQGGQDTVRIPGSWRADTAPELDEALQIFQSTCDQQSLRQEWRVRYDSWVDGAHANEVLGFRVANPVPWRNTPEELRLGISELSEAVFFMRLAT